MKLESEWGLTCKNSVEISPATWNQTEKIGVKKFLYRFYLSPETPTIPVSEEWDIYVLTENQIKLATSNAYFAFGIGRALLDGFNYMY